ncbi:claudin-2 [Microcaecilia unicolor]|uniref:Claudin n=1 Tax=Microcaecilia unicolor TaxID=1415580 RepID=A0A6P7YCU2_9AMPH|nr:claudin-2 [Microcaecilia unicolor]
MVSMGLQLMGYTLGLLGVVGTMIATLLPNWKGTAYVGSNIITDIGYNKGLWMECATQSTGITQCDIYNSLLDLPSDIQAAQAMMVTSCFISILACLISVIGMRCTVFALDSPAKDKIAIAGGAIFIIGGLLCLIPVAWNFHVTIQDFYNPLIPQSMKFEMGAALYLAMVSSLLSIIGGSMLCASCPPQDTRQTYYSPFQGRSIITKSQHPSVHPKPMSCGMKLLWCRVIPATINFYVFTCSRMDYSSS